MKTIKEKSKRVAIDPDILKEARASTDKCTIVHCVYGVPGASSHRMRIFPTTYLVQENGVRKKLLQFFNIPAYPEWKYFTSATCSFTLVFEGLDKNCKIFDLLEDIPLSGEFFSGGIKRNETDVYFVRLQ